MANYILESYATPFMHGGLMNTESWFSDKVCECDKFGFPTGLDWQELVKFEAPVNCKTCGKWANNCMTCCKCHEVYYQFFRHPCMGYHPKEGWYCWNCLQTYWPPIVEKAAAGIRIPPPAMVLPPGYVVV